MGVYLDWREKDKLLLGFDKKARPVWGSEEDLNGGCLQMQGTYGCVRSHQSEHSNILARGDNLWVLKTLEKDFAGRVQLIYVDPPFNAANGAVAYQDHFEHGVWLSMMKPRLEMARLFLKETGLIFIHIGNEEKNYLKVLCDEIFSRENFLGEITWQRVPSGRTALGQGKAVIPQVCEYLLVYAKDYQHVKTASLPTESLATEQAIKQYDQVLSIYSQPRLLTEKLDRRGNKIKIYQIDHYNLKRLELRKIRQQANQWIKRNAQLLEECRQSESIAGRTASEMFSSENFVAQTKKRFIVENYQRMVQSVSIQTESSFQQYLLSEMRQAGVLYLAEYVPSKGKRSGQMVKDYFLDGRKLLFLKDYSRLAKGEIYRSRNMTNFWTHDEFCVTGTAKEGGVTFKRSKKPESLLKRIIEFASQEGDWVLDCFLGSGTTAAAAHKMGRKWIGIECGNHVEEICLPRLKAVVSGEDRSGVSKMVDWRGGGGFRYYKLTK